MKPQISYEDFDKVDDGTEDASNWIVLTPAKDVPLGRRVK